MRRFLALVALVAAVLGFTHLGVMTPALAEGEEGKKVTICHATGSETNPFVEITISVNAVKAHENHQGLEDIIPAPAAGCPGAVVPPVVDPPAVVPPVTPPTVVVPPAAPPTVVVPPAAPPAAVPPVAPPAAVPAPMGVGAAAPAAMNPGFDAQTAVGERTEAATPLSLAGLAMLLMAGTIVALRRRARTR
ncbi:hypothetical protein [Arthrobacter cavernae]|uniref:LPXTG cell wall anchor domain-containing protein n=1 Tax=Arthrobacter cavernae TaxID=2817681 RepID=A0A939HE66_9MICC|nr:hypothetical protein [Arthrobacter cavernae]MBO1266710.1 hypothetical protein [Arthrobacter cavernae]